MTYHMNVVQERQQSVRLLGNEDQEGLLPIGTLQEDALACLVTTSLLDISRMKQGEAAPDAECSVAAAAKK